MAPRPDNLAQLVDQYKTKLVIAEEAKLQTKKEYTMHQDQMKQTFEKELHMKTAELKGWIAEIQNEKDKFRAKLDHMREEDKVTNKQQEQAIETERHEFKMSIQELRERDIKKK